MSKERIIIPKYKHDCSNCEFLGQVAVIKNKIPQVVDLYSCLSNHGVMIVTRSVDYPEDSTEIKAINIECINTKNTFADFVDPSFYLGALLFKAKRSL